MKVGLAIPLQTVEVYADGGYLSQMSSKLVVGVGERAAEVSVRVRWPDGSVSTTTVAVVTKDVVIAKKAAK